MYPGQRAIALGLDGMHEVLEVETCQRMCDLAWAQGYMGLTTSTAFIRDLTLDVVDMDDAECGVDGSLDDTTNSTLQSRSNAADFTHVGKAVMKTKARDGHVWLTKAKLDRRCFRGRRLSAVCRDGLASGQGRQGRKKLKMGAHPEIIPARWGLTGDAGTMAASPLDRTLGVAMRIKRELSIGRKKERLGW